MHQAGIVRDRDVGRRHRQNAVAQVGPGQVADSGPALRRRFPRPAPFRRGRRPPRHRAHARPEAARPPDNRSSAWRRPTEPGASATARSGAQPAGLPPAADFLGGNPQLRHRPFRRQRRPVRQRQRGVLVDEAGQRLLAPAPSVDQPEPGLADKTHPFRNTGQRRRDGRFPGAGQDQRGAVVPRPQLGRQPPLPGHRQPAARQVPDDAGAHARHVIDQRGAQGGGQEVDGPVRPALLQHPHDRVAAHEIADPHIGNDQDRAGVRPILRPSQYCSESLFISWSGLFRTCR